MERRRIPDQYLLKVFAGDIIHVDFGPRLLIRGRRLKEESERTPWKRRPIAARLTRTFQQSLS